MVPLPLLSKPWSRLLHLRWRSIPWRTSPCAPLQTGAHPYAHTVSKEEQRRATRLSIAQSTRRRNHSRGGPRQPQCLTPRRRPPRSALFLLYNSKYCCFTALILGVIVRTRRWLWYYFPFVAHRVVTFSVFITSFIYGLSGI